MSRSRRTLLACAALALGISGCKKVGPLHHYHEALVKDLAAADVDEWALRCAPEELARARAHRQFAELEFEQGDARRAEQHLDLALAQVDIALERAEACRPKDRDGDGLFDHEDQCPDEAETPNGFQDEDGCPDYDKDGDGIVDAEDACPDEPEDADGFEDTDGCPDTDNDNDTILDYADKCPNDAEDFNGFQDDDGCPEGVVDQDSDGILDNVDACPDEAENFNEYLDEDGCPDVKPQNVRVTKDRIEIDQKINFASGKAVILSNSFPILDSVAQVLRDYPAIKLRIEGHTDSQGSDSFNQTLSERRARAVRQYLQDQGIAAGRLRSRGLGETMPLDTNRTDSGRATNRRVEFHIEEGM